MHLCPLQALAAHKAFQLLCNEAAVVVADEAHQIKNASTKRFAAVTSLKTKRRIALTGYPLQNNMDEYYTMIRWCMDDILGESAYFHETFAKPIQEGKSCSSSGWHMCVFVRCMHCATACSMIQHTACG